MINPLEMRVALQALPDQGVWAHQENAASQYRQVQELRQSRDTSLARPDQVPTSAESQASAFHRVENPGEENPRRQELYRRRSESLREEAEDDAPITYAPATQRSLLDRTRENARMGQNLDLAV